MTLENFNYRTSYTMLRNQFDNNSSGEMRMPIIPKSAFNESDFNGLLLIGFDRSKNDNKNLDRMNIKMYNMN